MNSEKLQKLSQLNTIMLNDLSLQEALKEAGDLIKEIIGVERVSIFIYYPDKKILATYRADNSEPIVVSDNVGVVGYVATHKTIKVVKDTSKEPLFYSEIDKRSGYHTKNLIAVPILDNNKVLGVVELINKKNGHFSPKEITIANMFAQYISAPLNYLIQNHKIEMDNK
jgi:GAF domain-containing protein